MSSKLLEIYIPTYNREKWLKKTLAILSSQLRTFQEESHLTVCDNSSPNSITKLVAKYSEAEHITFRKNYGNIGANANIANAFCLAEPSKYLWILSDSDPPGINAIGNFLKELPFNADLILLSHSHLDAEEISITYRDGFIELLRLGIGQMSLAIYNREKFNTSLHACYFYHNSSFPHLALILEALKLHGELKIKILPQFLMLEKVDNYGDKNSDYRLSRVGMPLLMQLMSIETARKFSLYWIKGSWKTFHENAHFLPHVYTSSFLTLLKRGSSGAAILLILSRILWMPCGLFLQIKSRIRDLNPKCRKSRPTL